MDSGCVIIALLDSENNNCADVASASSLNNPNTVKPLPDKLANLALQSSNLLFNHTKPLDMAKKRFFPNHSQKAEKEFLFLF
jgi:hypothetical protein